MKKCASCTKDLPDAALHCVFCGAKQAPAPAVPAGAAKTVMGYSANEVVEHLKAQGQAPRPAPGSNPPPNQGFGARPSQPAGGQFPPANPSYPSAPPQYQPPAPAPSSANARTLFVPGGPGQQPPPAAPPAYTPSAPAPAGSFNIGVPPAPAAQARQGRPSQAPLPQPLSPVAPIPTYQQTHQAAEAGRPIEPWKDMLRVMMFIWGGVLLLAFLTPTSVSPELRFHFNTIIDAPGAQKVMPLVLAAVGLLSIVLAAIPMATMPRGLIAGLMGLTGIVLPTVLRLADGAPFQWREVVGILALLLLVPGLFLRQEYRESIVPRLMITAGVVAYLALQLVPVGDNIPLVQNFKGIMDLPGEAKIGPIIDIAQLLVVVCCLLAWMPSPSSGAGIVFAWLIIGFSLIDHIGLIATAPHLGGALKGATYMVVMSWAPVASFLVLVGYGFASVIAKNLE